MSCVRIVGRRVGIYPIIFCITSARVGVGVIIPGCYRRGIEEEERGRREREGRKSRLSFGKGEGDGGKGEVEGGVWKGRRKS